MRGKDYTGMRFGRLLILGISDEVYIDNRGHNNKKWLCMCDCGNIISLRACCFNSGKVKSCGCLKRELDMKRNFAEKHGDARKDNRARLYKIWCNIKTRCYNKNYHRYADYGGRGIIMCDEWRDDYYTFKTWAINNGYNDCLSIDRIDNNGNYCPDNCRWSNNIEQANKKRNSRNITIGDITHTMAEWARQYDIPYRIVQKRIDILGWEPLDALTRKIRTVKKRSSIKDGIHEKWLESSEQD